LEFPISEYYLVSRFYNIPKPFLLWPIIFIIIYSAEGLVYILASEKSTYMDNYVLGLFSNAFFSIAYIFITIFLYKINIKGINEWIRSNKNISEDADLINRLNLYHKYFFGRYALLLIFLILALRRGVIQIVSPEYQFIFGYIINDTITLFLLLSSAITVLTFFIQIYIVSSQGIQVSQPFEINIKYRDLESLVIKNTFVTGIALGLYGGALILWGKNVNQENVAMLLNVMTFSFILITFFTGLLGSELLPRPEGRGFPAFSSGYAVIALWHNRVAFSGNFRFPHHRVSLAYPGTSHSTLLSKESWSTRGRFRGCSLPRVACVSPRNVPYQGTDPPSSTLSLQGVTS